MNLPVILDVVIGLIFIYLTFSLLASEIQSIITMVLQWRATHLKKSIEELIAGKTYLKNNYTELAKVQKLANYLYQNKLIKNLNYSGSQGVIERGFRQIVQSIGKLIREITGVENIFGEEKTAPSYIPSGTFAASLIDTLKIHSLMQAISVYKLEKLTSKILGKVKFVLDNFHLEDSSQRKISHQGWQWLNQELNQTIKDYESNLVNLETTLERILNRLNIYTEESLGYLPETDRPEFNRKMTLVRQIFTNQNDKAVLLAEIQPSFTNLLKLVKKVMTMEETVKEKLKGKSGNIYQQIIDMISILPESLQNSLYILAEQAEMKVEEKIQVAERFQVEIEKWFDNGMERAAGVYKRNARGVAVLIGITIAVGVNIDALYMIDNLSKDSLLRATISSYSEQLVKNNPNPSELGDIQNQVNLALDNLQLPIGWNQEKNTKTTDENQLSTYLEGLKKVLGWLVSGIAISMGADFWFNFLKKLISIK